jgi:hypothetical protein
VYRRWSSKAQLGHEALFPALGPEPPADEFAAEQLSDLVLRGVLTPGC